MKALIFARVSSKDQEDGQSIPAQVRRLTEYALKLDNSNFDLMIGCPTLVRIGCLTLDCICECIRCLHKKSINGRLLVKGYCMQRPACPWCRNKQLQNRIKINS